MKYCDCDKVCKRWGVFSDHSGGFYTPYVPKGVEGHDTTCLTLLGEHKIPSVIVKAKM